jgi:PPOX class probable F420-dependent enzyme
VQIADVPPRAAEQNQSWKGEAMTTQTIERPVQRRAASLERLFPGRYLSVTSFKGDGTGVATPVWFVSDGTRLFALTDLHSAKVRRMRRNPHVLVAACRANGKLRGEPLAASAEVLTATPDLERVQQLLMKRHKLSYRLVMLMYRLGRRLRGRQSVADGAALAITVE